MESDDDNTMDWELEEHERAGVDTAEELEEHQCSDDEDMAEELEEYDSGNSVHSEEEPEEEYRYEVLNTEEIVNDMLKKIVSINTILEIPNATALVLLHHFKWDEEKLLEKFYAGDRTALFKDAHIVDPAIFNKDDKLAVVSIDECDICLNPLPGNLMTGLECRHQFCTDCWDEYLSTKVMGEGECLTILCPAHKCDILVDVTTAMMLIKDSRVRTKYQHLITQSFVECNRLLKWCPTPDCNRAVKVQYVDHKPVTCKCGQAFCFECNEKWHAPILCEYLRKWIKKMNEDPATATWIGFDTKECPNCNVMIEKINGCNHMTCCKCKYEFCWVCRGRSEDHGASHVTCNRYESAQHVPSAQERKRYLFYKYRYINHMKSLTLENKLYSVIEKKIVELLSKKSSRLDTQFLNTAVDVLHQCRQMLMYTYAFAYYLEKSNQTAIFEDNQQDLENATETLSHYLEQDIKNKELYEIKQKVLDKTCYCEKRRKILLDHVTEGYNKGWWKHLKIT